MNNKQSYRKYLIKTLPEDLARYIDLVVAHNRRKPMIMLREDIILILRDYLRFSYPDIGTILNRDHSAIMHLYKKRKAIERPFINKELSNVIKEL